MISYCLPIYRISITFALPKQNIFLLNLQVAVLSVMKNKNFCPLKFLCKTIHLIYICVSYNDIRYVSLCYSFLICPVEMMQVPNNSTAAAAAAKSFQSCPTLRDPMDCSLPGSSVHGIFQARVLE